LLLADRHISAVGGFISMNSPRDISISVIRNAASRVIMSSIERL
jgi:hypothetical protein